MSPTVVIIRTGTANLASVTAAFDRLSVKTRIIESPDQLRPHDAVVLPGVGTFAAGIQALNRYEWIDVLKKRFEEDRPTLAICLGLQLLTQSSDEAPGESGIGLLPSKASRFPENVCSPQFGWNRVCESGEFLKSGYAYYANSFCLQEISQLQTAGWNVATSHHGVEFVAAIQQGNWIACQFHPELSGAYGLTLLKSWLAMADREQLASRTGGAIC